MGKERDFGGSQAIRVALIGPDEIYGEEYIPKIDEVRVTLEAFGYEVCVPQEVFKEHGVDMDAVIDKLLTYSQGSGRVKSDVSLLVRCQYLCVCLLQVNAVYLMEGWERSSISLLLLHYAHLLSIPALVSTGEEYMPIELVRDYYPTTLCGFRSSETDITAVHIQKNNEKIGKTNEKRGLGEVVDDIFLKP